MALDSNGPGGHIHIPCFLCEKIFLSAEKYKPEVGHGGETLNLPYCIAPHYGQIKNLEGSRFFTIKPCLEKNIPLILRQQMMIWFKEYKLQKSWEAYHYHGYIMPSFGENIEEVIYVCKKCCTTPKEDSLDSSDWLLIELSQKWVEIINRKASNMLIRLLFIDGISLNKERITKGITKLKRSKKPFDDFNLVEDIRNLENCVRGMQKTVSVRKFLKKFKPAVRVVVQKNIGGH